MDDRIYWVGFNLVKGIGAVRFRALLDYFGNPETAWHAPADALQNAGLPQNALHQLLQIRQQIDLESVWARIEKEKIKVLTWKDEGYPVLLKEVDNPPPVLYLRGDIQPADDVSVSIVGTRSMTSYGKYVTEELATFLAQNHITVVSGLARGVDSVAHQAAVKANGRTLAVLGSGVDRIYPPEHRKLAETIAENGAIISDYAPGTPPDSTNFPPRNRIISGLSLATVVIEAGEKSGALITATFAANQGREVFAVPGNIHGPQSKGTNNLIQQGARPLLNKEEVLEALKIEQRYNQQQIRLALPVDDMERTILLALANEPLHIDDLKVRLDLPIDKISATLAMLELKGMIRQISHMSYIAV